MADAAEAERFIWCGYSWTAIWGQQLAVRTDRLDGLIGGGWPPIGGPFRSMLAFLRANPATFLSWCTRDDYEQVITFYDALSDFDDRAAQSKITCPRLCFAGGGDDVYGLAIASTITAQRSELERLGWDVRVVDDLDHMELLAPALHASCVRDWLDRRW